MTRKNLLNKTILIISMLILTGVLCACGGERTSLQQDTSWNTQVHSRESQQLSERPSESQQQVQALTISTAEQDMQDASEEQCLGELNMDFVIDMFEAGTLKECDYFAYSNGVVDEEGLSDSSLNYYLNFRLPYEGTPFELNVSYRKEDNSISAIYLTHLDSKDSVTMASFEDKEALMAFLLEEPDVNDWLSIELPESYTLEPYDGNISVDGGSLILPYVYESQGEYPFLQEWSSAGSIVRIRYAEEKFHFEDGVLMNKQWSIWNHTEEEFVERIDDMDKPALLYHATHDLYTVAEAYELEQQGIVLEETTSSYWYFYFAEEGDEVAYYLSLAEKCFTKEEAIEIARSVKFK